MIDDAAGFTGTIPEHYDRGLGPIIFVEYATEMAKRAAVGNPTRVLETAAGTGIVTRRLRDARAGWRQSNGDRSQRSDARDRTHQVPARRRGRVPACRRYGAALSGRGFDAVVCQFGIMFFPDRGRSYHEVHRVLAPRGRYLFSVWDAHRYNPFGRIAQEVGARFFPVDPPQFYTVPFSCHRIDPIRDAVADAGFADFEAAVVRLDKEIPDVVAFARGLVFGNPLIDQIRARGGVAPERIVEVLVEDLRREFGADPGLMPLQAIMLSAKKPAVRPVYGSGP